MQFKDIRKLFQGLNKDWDPSLLEQGEFTDAINTRVASSSQQHGAGVKETLQGEVELLINVNAGITYYGSAIGGDFIYSGYEEVTIGSQTWLKRNWDYNYPGSKVYNDDEANRAIYGGLYTWNQVMATDFCPPGWHIPTEAEVNTLLAYLGGELIAGGKMKEPGELHWNTPNTGANDLSGFKGLPGGKFDAIFSLLGEQGFFWIAGEGFPWAPVALPATDISPLTFMANWEVSDGADGYYLDVAIDAAFTTFVAGFNNLSVGNVLHCTVSGLVPSITYYYRVRAYNDIDTSINSNVITVSTTAIVFPLLDKDANPYTTIIIGSQEWIIENFKVTKYADGTPIPNITANGFTDWFLPSVDELQAMRDQLYSFGLGGFINGNYLSSTEAGIGTAHHLNFLLNIPGIDFKANNVINIRAIRSFAGIPGAYALRDVGPAGGLIFAYDAGLYYESSLIDIPLNQWSDVTALIGATAQGTAIGTGITNTAAIIGQVGHTNSAAEDCNDLSWGGWPEDTTGAYCWYDNDIANKTPYGALYNWYAVNNARELAYLERNGVQEGGWRVPTYNDFVVLANTLGGFGISGGKLKETGLAHWFTPNTGATNESGFTALPTGIRTHDTGAFAWFKYGFIWSGTELDLDQSYYVFLDYNSILMQVFDSGFKKLGFAVRLVRSTGMYLYDDTLLEDDTYLE